MMEKKTITTGKKEQQSRCSKASIPPSWQLNEAQRVFIDDLWQDDVSIVEASHSANGSR